ncbi:MAG: glycosyltransferase family 2 protein [Actinobacteria bacterium]|nr:MAG: glycosyltransferase family 2 protein [Actinomycetota bacterium]
MELRHDTPREGSSPAFELVLAVPPRKLPWGVGRFRFYLRVRTRFLLSIAAGLVWAGLSAWIAVGWTESLGRVVTLPVAILVIGGIAIIPGYLNVQLVSSLILDRPRPIEFDQNYPAVTLLIAAYNEEERIRETLEYALRQDYPGKLQVVVADDGSSDRTREVAALPGQEAPRVSVVTTDHGGKSEALNAALANVGTPLVATIDADTLLMPSALQRAIARMLSSPPDTVAVAGSVLVRNSRAGALARIQEWDYFLAIASVKRQQALFQGTLVAQGAFSVYRTEAVRAVGGWPNKIGEDIVLTWGLIRQGGRTIFEPTAIAFTDAPVRFGHFVRQRRRWARGMIEGLREHGLPLLRGRGLHVHAVAVNCLFPYLDSVYTIAIPVGIVLAVTGNFLIVGPMTAAVLPISLVIALTMYLRQRAVFRLLGLRIRRNILGFVLYVLVYQLVMSPISVSGYATELVRARRVW